MTILSEEGEWEWEGSDEPGRKGGHHPLGFSWPFHNKKMKREMMTFNQWPTTSFHCNFFATMSPGDHVIKRRGRWKDEMNRGSAIQSMTVEGPDHYQHHHHIGVRPSPQPSTLFLLSCSHPHVGKIEGPRASVHMRENTQCSTMLIKEFIVFRCNG